MCEPISMMAAFSAMAESFSAVAPIVEGIGALYSAGATYSAAKSGQAQAEANAKIAEQQGLASLRKGAQEEEQVARKERRIAGQQRAALGAAGVDINAGSPLDVQADTAYMAEQDKSLIRYNAELEKWGFDVQKANYQSEANAYGNKATGALVGGVISAGSSIVTGLGQVSDKWSYMQTPSNLTGAIGSSLSLVPKKQYALSRGLSYANSSL